MVQNEMGKLYLNVVKSENYNKADENAIINAFKAKLGNDFSIEVRNVDSIEKTRLGKQKYLIQNVRITGEKE